MAYDKASNQLTSGHGNLVNRAKKLEALGAKTTKQFSQAISDAAEDGAAIESGPTLIGLPNVIDAESDV